MSAPWATIVVPVYNTASWLPAALESIDRQSCRDRLEVVIIDDGSTDESSRIAREYAQRVSGARYVRQENAGLGAARNHGVRLATGEYLAFLDSDDIYPPDALHDLLVLADQHGASVVVGDMQGLPPRPNPAWRRELVTGERIITALEEAPDLAGNPSACNKVFRRDFVSSVGVEFSEGTAFEDVLFTLPLLLRSPVTVLTPRLAYLYRTRGDGTSIMDNRSQPIKIMQHLAIMERLNADLETTSEGNRRVVQRWIAYMQLHYAWRAATALDDDDLADFTRRMAAILKDVPVETCSEFVSNPGAGIRAASLYEQDVAGVRKPRFSGALRVRAGQVYAGTPHFARYRDLLRMTTLDMDFTRLVGGAELVVHGSCRIPALTTTPGSVRHDLLLEAGDGLIRRPLTVSAVKGDRMHWTCALPLDGLAAGRHRIRVVVRDEGREYPLPVGTGTTGSRAVSLAQGRVAWLAAGNSACQLVIVDGTASAVVRSPGWLLPSAWRRGRSIVRRGRDAGLRRLPRSVKPR